MWGRSVVLAALAAGPGGCLSSGPGEAGAIFADPNVISVPASERPVPPLLPVLACPDGWTEVADAERPEVVTCDPWRGGAHQTCEGAAAHFPGGEGCEPIGAACPDGPWADDLPDEGVIYVSADARGTATGSRTRPYGTLQHAIDQAQPGDVIALAKGTYDEGIWVDKAVTIRGACAAETTLTAPASDGMEAVVWMQYAGGASLRDLRVQARRIGVYVIAAQDEPVRLDDVLIEGTVGYGLFVADAVVEASDLVVRDVGLGGPAGSGISVEVVDQSTVVLQRASLERQSTLGIGSSYPGTRVTARDVVIDGFGPRDASGYAKGIETFEGGRTTLDRVVVEGMSGEAVSVIGRSTMSAADVVVRDTACTSDGFFGNGISVFRGGRAWLDRVWLARNRETALTVSSGGRVDARDLVITDTMPPEASEHPVLIGFGAETSDAALYLERAAILRTHGPALGAGRGTLDARDVSVLDGIPFDPADGRAFGLQADDDAQVALHAVRFSRMHEDAIFAMLGASITGGDVIVEDTLAGGLEPWGRGLEVIRGASIDLTRVQVRGAVGTAVYSNGGNLHLTSASIQGTREGVDGSDGLGLVVAGASKVELRDFVVQDNDLCGVLLAHSDLDLHDGDVVDNLLGAYVESADYDLDRLRDEVRWDNREGNLVTLSIPIPDPSSALPMQ